MYVAWLVLHFFLVGCQISRMLGQNEVSDNGVVVLPFDRQVASTLVALLLFCLLRSC